MNRIESEYFNWLCDKVISPKDHLKYYKLLNHLHNFIFVPLLEMDGNREDDAKQLRYRFGMECDIHRRIIARDLDTIDNCSILELMVALAVRCEETIMTDSEYGDRTGLWFWNMVDSLGLQNMTDRYYDKHLVNDVLYDFNNREYKPNGEGGLFTIPNRIADLRDVEIWYQMAWYLDTLQ